MHLIGHSTGGLLGLLYTRQYPEKVKSLTLLGVGVHAAVDWQAHYYIHRQFLSRQATLNAMVYNLFGYHEERTIKSLVSILGARLRLFALTSLFVPTTVYTSRWSPSTIDGLW